VPLDADARRADQGATESVLKTTGEPFRTEVKDVVDSKFWNATRLLGRRMRKDATRGSRATYCGCACAQAVKENAI
jgi:hypothetical protein